MNKHSMKNRTCYFSLLIMLGVFWCCSRAEATWHCIHGSSGHVESGATEVHKGTGLLVYPPEDPAWVHFQVPTIGETSLGARYVRIRFEIVNALNSAIKQVRVYNGGSLVKSFQVSWGKAGVHTKTLDLGSVKGFASGMGISVQIESGPDSGIDEYHFISVAADFVPKP